MRRIKPAKIQTAKVQIANFEQALQHYYSENNSVYPSSLEALVPDYLDEVPKDPWGNPYTYAFPGSRPNAATSTSCRDRCPSAAMTISRTTARARLHLIELAVALLIVALVVADALPRYGDAHARRAAQGEARRPRRGRALPEQRGGPDRQGALPEPRRRGTATGSPSTEGGRRQASSIALACSHLLAPGILIRGEVVGRGGRSRGTRRIGFFARGENEEAVLRLGDQARRRSCSIRI